MFLAARYPDRHARDETQRLLESGSSRFKPLLLILSDPAAELREMVANALCEITHQAANRSAMMSTSIPSSEVRSCNHETRFYGNANSNGLRRRIYA